MGRNNEGPKGQKKISKSKMYYQKQFRNQRGGHGGRGRGGQNSSGWGNQGPRKSALGPGMKGFLCTTNDGFEKQCIKEASNILNEYFAVIDPSLDKGPEEPSQSDPNWRAQTSAQEDKTKNTQLKPHDDDDIEAAIAAERKELNSEAVVKRFQPIDSGARNIVFISSNVKDPVSMVHKIFEDVYEKKKQKSMHLLRLLPVEVICRVETEEIKKAASELFPKYFKEGFNSFSIVYKSRNNNKVNRDEIISILGDCVTQVNKLNYVDLTNPNFSIIVEIIKGMLCLSVVTDYAKFKKYNLLEVGIDEETRKQNELENKRKAEERANIAKSEATNPDGEMTTSPAAIEMEIANSPISNEEITNSETNAEEVPTEDDGIQIFSNAN